MTLLNKSRQWILIWLYSLYPQIFVVFKPLLHRAGAAALCNECASESKRLHIALPDKFPILPFAYRSAWFKYVMTPEVRIWYYYKDPLSLPLVRPCLRPKPDLFENFPQYGHRVLDQRVWQIAAFYHVCSRHHFNNHNAFSIVITFNIYWTKPKDEGNNVTVWMAC